MNDKDSDSHRDRQTNATGPDEGTARRGFFARCMASVISVVLGLIPVGLGVGFFLDPLIRKRGSQDGDLPGEGDGRDAADGFIRLNVTVSSLPDDGTPVACKVLSDKTDAWNRFQNVEIGTVWLRRTGPDEVLALSSICPHLGCSVEFRGGDHDYFCPCHTSVFNLDGEKTNNIPPRGMDTLETRLTPETGDAIWLKYQNFRAATPEKIAMS